MLLDIFAAGLVALTLATIPLVIWVALLSPAARRANRCTDGKMHARLLERSCSLGGCTADAEQANVENRLPIVETAEAFDSKRYLRRKIEGGKG